MGGAARLDAGEEVHLLVEVLAVREEVVRLVRERAEGEDVRREAVRRARLHLRRHV